MAAPHLTLGPALAAEGDFLRGEKVRIMSGNTAALHEFLDPDGGGPIPIAGEIRQAEYVTFSLFKPSLPNFSAARRATEWHISKMPVAKVNLNKLAAELA